MIELKFFQYVVDGKHNPVARDEVIDRLQRGEVILVPGGMEHSGFLESTRKIILKSIEDVAGMDKRKDVEAAGLKMAHKHISVPQIQDVHSDVTKRLLSSFYLNTERFVREAFKIRRFFVNHNATMRFYLPNSLMNKHYQTLKTQEGKLVQHGPHHDYWQNVALNAINIWMAVENVTEANGMVIYNRVLGKILPRGKNHVREDQVLGRPLRIACKAGDIILFQSQLLHGGILNRSDETRVVLTTRFTIERPWHPRLAGGANYTSAASIRSGSERALSFSKLVDRFRPAQLMKKIEVRLTSGRAGSEESRIKLFDPWLKNYWYPSIDDTSRETEAGKKLASDAIEIIDDNTLKVKWRGKESLIQRRCPHMGGDLACGYVEDGHIWCPWHDQPFDLASGKPGGSCSGLRSLKIKNPA